MRSNGFEKPYTFIARWVFDANEEMRGGRMSDKTSDKQLKKCPFCGGNARISCDPEVERDSMGRLWAFTVVCDSCCATSGLNFTPERACESWNKRKPLERIVERLQEKKTDAFERLFDGGSRGIGFCEAIKIVKEEGGL